MPPLLKSSFLSLRSEFRPALPPLGALEPVILPPENRSLPYLQLSFLTLFSFPNHLFYFLGLPPQRTCRLHNRLTGRLFSPPPFILNNLIFPELPLSGFPFDNPDSPESYGASLKLYPHFHPEKKLLVESPHVDITSSLDLSCQEPVPVSCACPDSASAFDRPELPFFLRGWIPSWLTNASRCQGRDSTLNLSTLLGHFGQTTRELGAQSSTYHHGPG